MYKLSTTWRALLFALSAAMDGGYYGCDMNAVTAAVE